ncbi:MAG: nucleoside monophosphate kinase [Clostridiaceae bacterium]|nr:nucleoside monophosphate kinase [Clostridiaceae bacterium]
MQLVILGAPGAGKGTFSQSIKKYKQFTHIATGDIFRKHIKDQTDLGKVASTYIEKGKLVPNDLTDDLIFSELNLVKKDFILDGYPRNLDQAKKLDEMLRELKIPLTACVSLSIEQEVIVDRLRSRVVCSNCAYSYNLKTAPTKTKGICDNCGGKLVHRKDDSPEIVTHRIQIYERETEPVINYYEEQGKLLEIDCGEIDFVTQIDEIWSLLLEREVKV